MYKSTLIPIKIDWQVSQPITTNQGVRRGCWLSPTLFNIYFNKVTEKWKEKMSRTNGIQLKNKNSYLCRWHSSHNYIIRRITGRLNNIAKKYNLKISTSKTKLMGMCRNEIRRRKIIKEEKSHWTSRRIWSFWNIRNTWNTNSNK
jgi:hypothetical protein